MNAKTKFRKSKKIQVVGILFPLLITLLISMILISCEDDPFGSDNQSGGDDNRNSSKNKIDEGAATRCDYVYAWNDLDCWDDVSTPKQFHMAIICSHEALSKYYKCLKKYAYYPAGFCDCHSSCHDFAALCIGGCEPGNPALEEQTCLEGCVEKIGDCLSICNTNYPFWEIH